MLLAVISDLHIGADDFVPDGFPEFLDHLESSHDEIVLLGDVVECYFPALPWGGLREYDRHLARFPEITDRFRSSPYTVLSGNHDMAVRRARGVGSRVERTFNGYRVLLAHGHDNEAVFQSPFRTRVAEIYMWLAYRLKRLGFPLLYVHGYRVDYENNMRDGGALHLEAARRLVREGGYDVVVFGHTHVERHVLMRGGGTYINTGDCLKRRMYCSIDLKRRRCELREFRGRHVPVEHENDTVRDQEDG